MSQNAETPVLEFLSNNAAANVILTEMKLSSSKIKKFLTFPISFFSAKSKIKKQKNKNQKKSPPKENFLYSVKMELSSTKINFL